MTNIEQEFFKTFGIEPKDYYGCDIDTWCPFDNETCNEVCPYWVKYKTELPKITDRVLLELICLHSTWSKPRLCATNIEAIKRQVLRDLIFENCDKLKYQVQSLFREEGE